MVKEMLQVRYLTCVQYFNIFYVLIFFFTCHIKLFRNFLNNDKTAR